MFGKSLENVWKVFSQQPLTVKDLSDIFSERREVKVCDWLAYPNYSTNQTLSDFVKQNFNFSNSFFSFIFVFPHYVFIWNDL